MSIPKSLILYRAQRHRTSLPANVKQGYYSDKISLTPFAPYRKQYINFPLRYQQKFAREISLKIIGKAPEVRAILPKIPHITKFKIEPADQIYRRESIKFMAKEFRGVFKVLKRIKKLVIKLCGEPQDRARVSKSLLLLPNLESLILPNVSYSEDSKTLKLFMEAVKLASKRKSWFNLKSLDIQLQSPPNTRTSYKSADNDFYFRSLKLLLEFVQGLKSCQKIYNCSRLELNLSPWASLDPEQAALLTEIAPLITGLTGCEANRFSALPDLFQHFKHLNTAWLEFLGDYLQPDFDLSILNGISNFQDLTLSGVFLEEKLFAQIKSLENLTALCLRFQNGLSASSSEALYLVRVISDLANLRSLELDFSNEDSSGPRKSTWLSDVFQAIGEKSKIEKLSLTFIPFDFEKTALVFEDLCENIEKLTNLSDLRLHILHADALEDKQVQRLDECWSKLPKIQDLTLRIVKESSFSTKIFFALIDGLARGLPLLSKLELIFGSMKMNNENLLALSKEFNKFKYLGYLNLLLACVDTGIFRDVCVKGLAAEIRKMREVEGAYLNLTQGSVLHL